MGLTRLFPKFQSILTTFEGVFRKITQLFVEKTLNVRLSLFQVLALIFVSNVSYLKLESNTRSVHLEGTLKVSTNV